MISTESTTNVEEIFPEEKEVMDVGTQLISPKEIKLTVHEREKKEKSFF